MIGQYRIAVYLRGVLTFVIFEVHPGVTKFSTHEIYGTLYRCLHVLKFGPATFCHDSFSVAIVLGLVPKQPLVSSTS